MTHTEELNWFDKQAEQFERARFAAMTIMITAQSCFGSIAAYYALHNESTVTLAISAAVTMASNALFISQAPAKWCLGTFYTSVIVNTLILLGNAFLF